MISTFQKVCKFFGLRPPIKIKRLQLTKEEIDCYRILKEKHYIFLQCLGTMENVQKFIANIDLTTHKRFKSQGKKDYISKIDDKILILAFSWSVSPEGDTFWREINANYRKKLGLEPYNWR